MRRNWFLFLIAVYIASPLVSAQNRPDSDISPTRFFTERDEKKKGWLFIAESDSDMVFRRKSGLQRSPNGTVKIWIKYIPIDRNDWRGSEAPENMEYMLELEEINCPKETSRILSIIMYDRKGSPISSKHGPPNWEDIIPESVGEKIFNYVCKRPQGKTHSG